MPHDHEPRFFNNIIVCCSGHTFEQAVQERLTNIERILMTLTKSETETLNAVTALSDGVKSLIATFDAKFAELAATVTQAGLSEEAETTILAKVKEAQDAVTAEATKLGNSTPTTPPNPPVEPDPSGTTQFRVSGPSTATSGEKFSFTVESLDASGSNVQGYLGPVIFSSGFSATLPDSYTFNANDGGVHVFSVTPRSTGTFTLAVSDAAHPDITGSYTVTVTS